MSSKQLETIRWGIIGCGDVTEKKSGPALQKLARSELLSVMRRDGDKAADYARRHNVPNWTDDVDTLLGDPDINAVYIATPPNSHADYAIRALKAGKHVLLEKPIAMNAAECDAIEAAVKETNGKLSVAYYRRALPRFEKMRQIIQDGTIGKISTIEVRQFKTANNQAGQAWKTDPSIGGGGSFVDMQSHTLDWLTYLFGMPVKAVGTQKNILGLHAAEDLVNFLLDFDAFTAVGLCSYAAAHEEETVVVHGDLGSVSMGFFRPSEITVMINGVEQHVELSDPEHVHQPFIERVLAYFLDGADNPCSASDGRLSSELIDQIFGRA